MHEHTMLYVVIHELFTVVCSMHASMFLLAMIAHTANVIKSCVYYSYMYTCICQIAVTDTAIVLTACALMAKQTMHHTLCIHPCNVYTVCSFTWNGVFLIYGGLGLAWLALWVPLAQDAPPDKLQLKLQLPSVVSPSLRDSSSSSQTAEQQLQSPAAVADSSSIDSAVAVDKQQQQQQNKQLETPVGLKGMP
jgi:hypothetical protein